MNSSITDRQIAKKCLKNDYLRIRLIFVFNRAAGKDTVKNIPGIPAYFNKAPLDFGKKPGRTSKSIISVTFSTCQAFSASGYLARKADDRPYDGAFLFIPEHGAAVPDGYARTNSDSLLLSAACALLQRKYSTCMLRKPDKYDLKIQKDASSVGKKGLGSASAAVSSAKLAVKMEKT